MSARREDFAEILRLVRPGARVLDVGCEDGELLELLTREKQVDGQGLEISPAGVAACLAKGLAVVQGDGDRDLDHFPTRAFDYAILSKTLQQMREPRHVLSELLRIADQAIELVKPGGKIMFIGIPEVDRISFNMDHMRRKEICIQNVRRQNHCVQAALDMIAAQECDVNIMTTHHFPLERAQEAFDLVASYRDGVVKAMIEF